MQKTQRHCAVNGQMNALVLSVIALAGVFGLVSGCASTPAQPSARLEVMPANYDAAFDVVLDVLRADRFVLDRVDRRLGIIVTKPRASASFVEPWKGDNATFDQAMESTLHYQRRIVRISFVGFGVGGASGVAGSDDRPAGFLQVAATEGSYFDASSHGGTLVVQVACDVERGHRPGMQIQPLALRSSNVTTDPALGKRGISSRFWAPLSRDGFTEARLVSQIAQAGGDSIRVVPYEDPER